METAASGPAQWAGLGVGCQWEALRGAASGPGGAGDSPGGWESCAGQRRRRARARPPKGRRGGGRWRGGGARTVGEGRSRASHNNKSQALPTPTSKPPVSRDPGCTHSGRGSVRAPSGCGVGGWRVYRSLSPGGPAPARPSSGPNTSSSAPTSGSPATQANGFRKSRLILRGLRVAPRCPPSLSAGTRCRRPGALPRPARFSALFSVLTSFCTQSA